VAIDDPDGAMFAQMQGDEGRRSRSLVVG